MSGENPYYLRKYRVVVYDGNNVALDVSDLRVTFHIERKGYHATNFGDVSIYNLSLATKGDIIHYGMRVTIEAGYQTGEYGLIFDGNIFQPIWDRKNVVDYRLTLHCMDGLSQLNYNLIQGTVQASHDMRSDLLAMIKNAGMEGDITQDIDSIQMPRGRVFFGQPKKLFRQIANANNAQWCFVDQKLLMTKLSDVKQSSSAIVISADSGLIGTPQQIEYGVNFKTLINPNIVLSNPPMQVQIKGLVQPQSVSPPKLQSRLSQDGFYVVGGVTHVGDTRGQEWYTECTGYNLGLYLATLSGQPQQLN